MVALTGYLGAGKTTLLNHVLRTARARIGVVVNDFGELNVDAGLVSGQIDEPASIAGGCICCLPDNGGLDDALAKLTDPRLDLDVIIVETSGLADPVAVARLIGFSELGAVRSGGVVDVLDATTHFDVVDRTALPPARYAAASLVVVNKIDQLPAGDREPMLERVKRRVHESNPRALVIGAVKAAIDPALLYDVSGAADEPGGQLSMREMFLDAAGDAHREGDDHAHAVSVSVTGEGCVEPGVLLDLLEDPPAGVYRIKGTVRVRHRSAVRSHVVNVVGGSIHVAPAASAASTNGLVAIGMEVDTDDAGAGLRAALRPHDGPPTAHGLRRFKRYQQ